MKTVLLVGLFFLNSAVLLQARQLEINDNTAESLFFELHQIQTETSRPEFRNLLTDLSHFFKLNKKYQKAIAVQETLVQRVSGELGATHESLIKIFESLSEDYAAVRDFKSSAKYHDAQWALWSIVSAFKNNPMWNHEESVAIAMFELAEHYIYMKKNNEAVYLLNKAINIFSNISTGLAHPKSLEAREKLEYLQQKMDKKYTLDCSESLS